MSETAVPEILDETPAEATEPVTEEVVQQEQPATEPAQEEAEEVVIGFKGEESPPQDDELLPEKANARFAEMRIKLREAERKLREVEAAPVKAAEAPTLGAEPDPIDFDIWDDEGKQKYKQAVSDWYAQKAKVENAQAEARKQAEEAQKAWRETVEGYTAQKQALKVPDYEDAEEVVRGDFNETQQGIILHVAKKEAAKLVYALGKSDAKRSNLAAIKNPAEFAFELGRLSTEVTMQPKTKPKTSPEPGVKPSAPSSGLQSLDTLQAKARETGDYAAYHAAKRASNR
jgi:hypothetical protein